MGPISLGVIMNLEFYKFLVAFLSIKITEPYVNFTDKSNEIRKKLVPAVVIEIFFGIKYRKCNFF